MIKFGSAGNPRDFYNRGLNKSEYMPEYLSEFGLDAYEYQCSRGVRVSDEKARLIRQECVKHNITLSVHAPYYISLSSTDERKKDNSIQYIIKTAQAADKMGADRIVVHSGALLGLDRKEAMNNSVELLKRALYELDKLGLGHIKLCPETMGKLNQLGDSKEVIQLCLIDKRLIPTIDFGHLYCRSLGKLKTKNDWIKELSQYIEALGYERVRYVHSHFSKMRYTENGGEKCHVTFSESDCGPDFEIIAEVIIALNLEPRLICESAGTQSEDAKTMKEIYYNLKNSNI